MAPEMVLVVVADARDEVCVLQEKLGTVQALPGQRSAA